MRKLVVAALIGALTLSGAAIAWADHDRTTVDTQFTTGKRKAGKATRPASNSFTLRLAMDTTDGTGQPETVSSIILLAAAGWQINSERYPRNARCDIRVVNQRGSDSVCPRRARAGRGVVNLEAGGGSIKEVADLRAWVSRTGDIFIFLDSRPGEPVELNAAVPCAVSRRSRARCNIPDTLQRPAGVKSTIERLVLTLGGSVRVGNRRIHLLTTRACRRNRWSFGLQLRFFDGGSIRDSDRVTCRR